METDLLGIAELAAVVGVTKRTAITYSQRADFPRPLARLAAGPVWDRRGVEAWVRNNPPRYAVRPRR